MRLRFAMILAALALGVFAPMTALAQEGGETDLEKIRKMTREERIKAHQARIEKIIKETRERQAAEAKKVAESPGQKPAQPGATPAAQPGTPLPAGPVTAFVPPPGHRRRRLPPFLPPRSLPEARHEASFTSNRTTP